MIEGIRPGVLAMSESEKVSLVQVESLPEEPKPEEVKLEEPKLAEPTVEELRLEGTKLEEDAAEETAAASADAEEFSNLLDSYSESSRPSTGTLLRGHVVNVTESEVIVDVGYKCEGVIALEEFRDDWGNLRVKPGDAVEVMMESTEERD
ncbi:MAG: S1 RNA-binding domain-containing protein, partial [Terriglobia bacterium]